jgi:hypothetical protein
MLEMDGMFATDKRTSLLNKCFIELVSEKLSVSNFSSISSIFIFNGKKFSLLAFFIFYISCSKILAYCKTGQQ